MPKLRPGEHGVPPGSPGVVPAPRQWSPAERAYALSIIQQSEARRAYYEELRSNNEIAYQLSEIYQSIRDLPRRQYIWGQ
jgi:hypothetical protein